MDEKRCFHCGTPVIWDSDTESPVDDETTLSYYHCPKCGYSYEVAEPSEQEKKEDYKDFWEK